VTRPKARMKLGQHLVGDPPWRSLPHGVVVYAEWDPEDQTTYTWEEWEVLGYENLDFWVEYDHYTRQVTLYRPLEVVEHLDPTQLTEGQWLGVTWRGETRQVRVDEVGVGRIVHLEGAFTYDLEKGQDVAYAELRGNGFVLSVEKFDERVLDVYHGTVLDTAGQKAHFGKRVAPRSFRGFLAFLMLALVLGGIGAACSRTVEDCTPRTVVDDRGVVTTSSEQVCVRRSVFGGAGLLGK